LIFGILRLLEHGLRGQWPAKRPLAVRKSALFCQVLLTARVIAQLSGSRPASFDQGIDNSVLIARVHISWREEGTTYVPQRRDCVVTLTVRAVRRLVR